MEEAERLAAAAVDDDDEPGEVGGDNSKKINNKNKKKKKSIAQRKANAKKPQTGSGDLTSKVFATMEKHKEVFFTIRLHSAQSAASLGPIHDPDPLMQVQGEKVRFQTFDLSTNGCSIFVLIKRNSSKSSCSHIMSANFGGIQSPPPRLPLSAFVSILTRFLFAV